MAKPRTEGFRLGTTHGCVEPRNPRSEANLQRSIFLLGSARFVLGGGEEQLIRWAGYEMPTGADSRTRAIDLIGYDASFNVYLVELKKGGSREPLDKVIKQIDDYAKLFEDIRSYVEAEFKDTFFQPEIKLGEIRRVILAPKRYFLEMPPEEFKRQNDVAFAYVARCSEAQEATLIRRNSPLRLAVLNNEAIRLAWHD